MLFFTLGKPDIQLNKAALEVHIQGHDKRETEREKDAKREAAQAMKKSRT